MKYLPEEFKSGNSVPVERATITRQRMVEILAEAIGADRQTRGEPVAWISDSPTKGNGRRLFWTKADAWRWSSNVKPLYATPEIPEGYKLVPQRLINLCEQFTSWRSCMSYNDTYFGEPEGWLKSIAAEMKRAMFKAREEA